jgi:hypothetical protein
VVNNNPSDRTAGVTILPADAEPEKKKALASALAGSAVGPVFPRYFALQAVCGLLALVTALSWWNKEPGTKVHRRRVILIAVAAATIAAAWPISNHVSALRPERYSTDSAIAAAAKVAFNTWHFVSLALSFVTVCLAGIALAMAARLPREPAGAAG